MEAFSLTDERPGVWEKQDQEYIYKHLPSGKFVFSDETENFNGPYDSAEEASKACTEYASLL